MWEKYLSLEKIKDCGYEAWEFGAFPDELAALVKNGIKIATSSAYDVYALSGGKFPQEGAYSVILLSDGSAACIIRTVRVEIVKFCEVSAEFARKEGEGDKSLNYWHKVHEEFFKSQLAQFGLCFSADMKVVCEEFELVYANQ